MRGDAGRALGRGVKCVARFCLSGRAARRVSMAVRCGVRCTFVMIGSGDNTLKVWDIATGKCLATLRGHSNYVKGVAVFPDGRRVVSASWDKTLKVEGHSDWVQVGRGDRQMRGDAARAL
uniref:Anaphase-promoting complex subunit 4 WD40 domain-containing protein n=1 Tax=Pelagomonas calceolata TaxID=35677 RepID=A0A7S4EB03_9STRA